MTGVTRSIEIQAPIDTVYGVITDYERYPEFLNHMTAAKVLRRAGGVTTVEFELDLIKVFHYVLNLTDEPPHRLSWTLEEGRWMVRNSGSWELVDLGATGVRATYTIDLDFEIPVPRGIMTRLAGTSLPQSLEAFRRRAEGLANP
jgi:ribosome-associated toxin RatA of RatAB toxin-antitoxin module